MSNSDQASHQVTLLNISRRRLGALLTKARTYGINNAPETQIEIENIRREIAETKSNIRNLGYVIEDEANDFIPEVEKTSIPVGAKVTIEFENNTKILIMPDAV